MNIDITASVGGAVQQKSQAPEQIDVQRKNQDKVADTPQATPAEKGVQSEELLSQIKAVTENGAYSVRFEQSDNKEFVVKIYDEKTKEVIRQIPAEEMLKLKEALKDLTGNIVDTKA
jgi:flagellar protein FlaG